MAETWNSVKYLQILLLYLLTSQLQSGLTQITGACKHNEFRCADGSGCLTTEKICNGQSDCADAEDERGNSQWDCSRETLQSDCSPSELKCRFGGCIPKSLRCNGVPDCWGGNDEAVDLCAPRPSGTIIVKPGSSSLPAVTSSPVISARPTPPPPPPAPELPPALPPNVPIYESPKPSPNPSKRGCPALPSEEGVEINCYSERFRKVFDCTGDKRVPVGSEATYSCNKYYSSPKTAQKITTRVCGRDGRWSPRNPNWRCDLRCGIPGPNILKFIVQGSDSSPNRWPWHAALYHEDPPNSGKFAYKCGGTLISTRAVLTAAHCAVVRSGKEIVSPIRVILGKHHSSYGLNETEDKYSREFQVVDVDVHENYESTTYNADIAILWLDQPVDVSDGIRPCCLPSRRDNVSPGDDEEHQGTLAGWGRTKETTVSEDLQELEMPVIDIDKCKRSHPTLRQLVRESTFCAGFKNKAQSACDGDSGGGLVFKSGEPEKYTVKGIVSAGVGKRGGGCDENHFTVFTKVSTYREWIDSKLSSRSY